LLPLIWQNTERKVTWALWESRTHHPSLRSKVHVFWAVIPADVWTGTSTSRERDPTLGGMKGGEICSEWSANGRSTVVRGVTTLNHWLYGTQILLQWMGFHRFRIWRWFIGGCFFSTLRVLFYWFPTWSAWPGLAYFKTNCRDSGGSEAICSHHTSRRDLLSRCALFRPEMRAVASPRAELCERQGELLLKIVELASKAEQKTIPQGRSKAHQKLNNII
jgi:hypothetical protein